MAIDGLETGAFAEGGDLQDGRLVEARSFLESPLYARDSAPQRIVANVFSVFVPFVEPATAAIQCLGDEYYPAGGSDPSEPFGHKLYRDGHHGAWGMSGFGVDSQGQEAPPAIYVPTFGSGWQHITYAQFFGNDYPGEPDNFQIAPVGTWLVDLNADSSLIFRNYAVCPYGVYSGHCGFFYDLAGRGFVADQTHSPPYTVGQRILPLQLQGACSFQIISADFKQTIDVTPANCGTTAQGIVPITFDSVALFGRQVSFYPQAKMPSIGNPWMAHPTYDLTFYFGPCFDCGLQ